jgi:rubrerythrin
VSYYLGNNDLEFTGGAVMDDYTKSAIVSAIRTEKASHDFYLLAASRASNGEARRMLLQLAAEEFEHLTGFIRLYPGDRGDIASLLSADETGTIPPRDLLADCHGIDTLEKALAIAIQEEQACAEQYSAFVATIRIPEVHDMFKRALDETERHLATIEAEYASRMGMVNDTEMDTFVRE